MQKDKWPWTAKFTPTIGKKDDLGSLSGQSEKEKEEILGGKDVNIKLQGILSKLEVSQDYASLARQVRQELDGNPSVDTLRSMVSLIFENAVMHLTQCAMYAQLCMVLSKLELPDFPGDKKITFRRLLLNTCQEEFEKLTKLEQAGERDDKERRLNSRALGNIKLIGELFMQKLLRAEIVHACIQELLGQDPKATPAEENVEALCHLFTTMGKQLQYCTKSKMAFETYFARLKVIGESTALPLRIQHMVRSIFDLRSKRWVSPQEMEAKKINEIHAKVNLGQRLEATAFRKGRPAAPPNLLPVGKRMVPGMSVLPSILGMPGMPRGGGPVQLVDASRKASVDKEALLSVAVPSDLAKVMEFGSGRVAATPKPRVREQFGVRSNKDHNYNLRELLRRVQIFDK